MPTTFKALVREQDRRRDGTFVVRIRVTHRRKVSYVATNAIVVARQLTKKLELKDTSVIDLMDETIHRWRGHVARLGLRADDMDVREIVEWIRHSERFANGFRLDFIAYARQVADQMNPGTARNYRIATNALERYTHGRALDIAEITPRLLADFERFLRDEPSQRGSNRTKGQSTAKKGARAVSLYLGAVRAIHNRARAEFNDESLGEINIPGTPFSKYKVPKEGPVKKRAVGAEIIQRIIDLEDEPHADQKRALSTRRDLARDCFLLSFGLAGMNAVDLYGCPASALTGDIITYNRQKTASRRADQAEMQIRIEPQLANLVARYRDPTGDRLFRFHRQYASADNFNAALGAGLERVAKAVGVDPGAPRLTFYAARHTWATVARSSTLNIDKYTVHEALNHVDAGLKITDRYITRDWTNIWSANAAVVGLFDWSKLEIREMLR